VPPSPQTLTNYLGEQVTILPRQTGETQYAYRNRRTVALTGETLYQRRIRQGRARGLTTTEARGQTAGSAARRRERSLAQTGLTPWQRWWGAQASWLLDNGFTPAATGWSWNKLIRIAPRLRWLNERAAPGAQIKPEYLLEATQNENMGVLEKEWAWERINERYIDTVEFVQYNNRAPGNFHWFQDRIPELPVQWWYYH
jgi:hypothetical protein